MIQVDGIQYSADQVEEAIRERNELKDKVKKLMGPFTCGHNPEYAGGACAACHAIWLDAAEKAEQAATAGRKQFTALLAEAMNRLCPDQKKCDPGTCPGADLGKWAIRELVPSNFLETPSKVCPGCAGSGEYGLADGEVPCLMCCGSGDRTKKGVFYQGKPKCGKCGKQNSTVTFATFLKKPEWPYLCHKCDRPE
jgi:hypothetical protein